MYMYRTIALESYIYDANGIQIQHEGSQGTQRAGAQSVGSERNQRLKLALGYLRRRRSGAGRRLIEAAGKKQKESRCPERISTNPPNPKIHWRGKSGEDLPRCRGLIVYNGHWPALASQAAARNCASVHRCIGASVHQCSVSCKCPVH
jgi:hypothetical protein